MKLLNILRVLITITYYLICISAILTPIAFFILGNGYVDVFTTFGYEVYNLHWSFYIIIALSILGYYFLLGMVYHLRKVAYTISPRLFINAKIENHFYKAGLYCLIGALITRLPSYIYHYLTKDLIDVGSKPQANSTLILGFSFDSILVILTFGVFLIIISKIMKQALKIQEENDLTI
ncbi:DUF2975 domain-containing protein [Nonlabens sp.]|uniref:DUF2975 domain-containing protein n=1 Tax=Nonlabens sp. TaxID=1888209 RepID=UPI003F696195